MKTIEKIKEIAEKEGITRYRIAKNTGISDILLKRYLNGEVTASIKNIEKIVEALGYDIVLVKKENSE